MGKRNSVQLFAIALSALGLCACASTAVHPESQIRRFGLPRPQQIIVYNFAVTESEVTEGPIRKMLGEAKGTSPTQQGQEIGRQVANVLAEELVRGLREFGFSVERKPRGTPIGSHELLIDGEFLDIDEGNRLGRLVIGFGMGASRVDTEVDVYYGARHRDLLDFRTHSDSGSLPGAAATMGAGAAIEGGVTAGMAVASAAEGAFKEYHSEVERMAAHSADQAVAYLSEFFAKQGWIRPDQVKKANVVQ